MALDDELWRRAQSRREAAMGADLSVADQMILPLVLSLARLAAQRDVRARRTPIPDKLQRRRFTDAGSERADTAIVAELCSR